jgi:hypothetical protein
LSNSADAARLTTVHDESHMHAKRGSRSAITTC